MPFQNLQVTRIATHEVFKRAEDRAAREPVFGDELWNLDAEARGAFRQRLTDVLAPGGQTLEMDLAAHGQGSFVHIAEQLIDSDDPDWLMRSRAIATKLAGAQQARPIPGGILVVFQGTAGVAPVPYIGVIKAEMQGGFRRLQSAGRSAVEFLNNIFLTPSTRLYKVGMMLRIDPAQATPAGWRAFIFDANMTAAKRESAGAYFYDAFLGCTFPSSGAYETARFFDLTKSFIRGLPLPPERKRTLVDSLYVFVRDEQAPTFTSADFGQRYLPLEYRDPYAATLRRERFRETAVVRDLTDMGTRLRRRAMKFGGGLELRGTPEALATQVTMEAIEGDGDNATWTRLTIHQPYIGDA